MGNIKDFNFARTSGLDGAKKALQKAKSSESEVARKLAYSVEDLKNSLTKGFIKTLEGIYDAGAGIFGGIGGLFSDDFKDDVSEHIKFNFTEYGAETAGWNETIKHSYIGEDSFVRKGAEAIGGMLPSVALSFVPVAGPTLGMVTTGLGAGGNAMESALNDGAGYYESLNYGTASGIFEGVTEKIGGYTFGGGKSLVGKKIAGTTLGKFTSKGIGKVAETFVSEGFEEVLADAADPLLKATTGVDTDIGKNYKTVIKNLPETFLLGGTVGSIFGGANVGVNAAKNANRGGIRASRADESFSYISEVSKNYGNDVNKNARYDKAIDDALMDVSRELSSMDKNARKNYMDGMGAFKNAFNDDGSIKMDLRADSNDGAVSSNLRAISAVLEHAPVSADTQISEGASKAKSTVEKLLGERASVVISDKIGKNNALYNPNEGIIYINNNAEFSGEEIAEFVATHEVAHITEGTRAYAEMAIALEEIENDKNAPASLKDKIGNVKAREQSIRDTYQGQMENMSLMQREYLVGTELTADLAGIVFSDEYAINKLAERNLPLAKKIFNGLKALVKRNPSATTGRATSLYKGGIDGESARYLNKLVNKFGKAIDKSQGGVKISQLGRRDEEKNTAENVDFVDEKRYNKTSGAYSQYRSLAMQWANATNTKKGETKMLFNAQNDTWNLIIADDSDMGYSELLSIKDTKQNANYINELFNEVRNEGDRRNQDFDKELSQSVADYWNESGHSSVYNYDDGNKSSNGRVSDVYSKQSGSDRNGDFGKSERNSGTSKTKLKEIRFDDEGNVIDEIRYSKPKSEKFMPGRYLRMTTAEELVEGYDADMISAEEALKKLNVLGLQTDITIDNALDTLREFIPEIREFAASEREAYRESNRKNLSNRLTSANIDEYLRAGDRKNKSKIKALEEGKKIILETEDEIKTYINNAIDGEKNLTTVAYGVVSNRLANDVKLHSNGTVDIENSYLELVPYDIAHAYREHINAKETGDIDLSDTDFERIPEYIDNYDKLEYVTQYESGNKRVCLSKRIGNGRILIIETISKSRGSLQFKNMIGVSEKKYAEIYKKETVANARGSQSSNISLRDETVSNTSIDENSQKINSKQKKTKLTSKKAIKSLVLDVADIFSQTSENGEDIVLLPKEAETNIVTAIWKKVNAKGVYNMKNFANRMSKQIMQNIVLGDGNVYKVNTTLKSIMHRIDLSELNEIIPNKDKLKYSSRWQLQEGKEAITIEDAVAELNNLGFQILSIDKLQMMEEINHIYEDTKLYIDEKDGRSLAEIMGEEEYKKAQSKISNKILDTLINAEKQTESELHNVLSSLIIENTSVLEKYREYRKEFKADEKRIRKELNYVHQIEEIDAQRKHTYTPAQQPRFNELADVQKLLGKTIHNGNINLSSFRESMGALSKWYTKDNELIGDAYDSDMADAINYFKDIENAEREPSNSELDIMTKLAAYVKNFAKNFGKIYRAGHWVDITEIAIKDFNSKSEAIDSNTPLQSMCQRAEYITTPLANATMWDGQDPEGELTRYVTNLQHGELIKAKILMDVHEQVTKIMEKDKKLFKKVISGELKVKCGTKLDLRNNKAETIEIPVDVLVNMYNTLRTKGKDDFSLEETGYSIKHANSAKKDYMTPITPDEIRNTYNSLPEPIKELAEWMMKWNNTEGKRYKMEADLRKNGYSNVIEGDYWNEIREHHEGTNDMQRRFGSNGIGAHGFNNERVKGAKARFVFDGFIEHFFNHVEELLNYNILDPIKTDFDKVMQVNIDVNEDGTVGAHKSIKMLIESQGFFHYGLRREKNNKKRGEKSGGKYTALDYMEDLSNDVFGVKTKESSEFNKIVGWIRGSAAVAALGANPKVWATQFSSLIAGLGELNVRSVIFGISNVVRILDYKKIATEVDEYCDWAKVRHFEKGATKAMTLVDKWSKWREIFTKPIELFDRLIVMLEFEACKMEAQSRYGLKIGTEENKIKAGELLTEVGLMTQQNQYYSTKSAIARSDNEFAKGFAMFKNDATAVIGRLIEKMCAWSVINKKIKLAKEAGDTALVAELEKLRNKAKRKAIKYTTVVILSCAFMTGLARLFNYFYEQDEDDENTFWNIMKDFIGNFLGMFPIVSEISSYLLDGYDVDNSFYSSLNTALGSINKTIDLFKDAAEGKNVTSEEAASAIRNDFYAIGQLTGVPAKNLYKNAKWVIGWASNPLEDRIDALFSSPSEKSLEEKIEAGIEKGDDKAVSASLDLLYGKYNLELEDAVLRREYGRLMRLEMTKGEDDETKYSPLEAKMPDSIKIDEEEVELLQKDVNVFKNAFKELEKSQANVVKTLPYKKLTDEQRAYALRKISQYYLEDTKYTYTGEKSNFAYYAKVVGIEDMALIVAYAKNLEGDAKQSRREKIEAYIKSLRLNKVQTSLALRCLGYSDKENDEMVMSYVKKCYLLTKTEREELYEKVKPKEEEESSSASTKASSTKKVQFVFN